jgi:GTPase SAR1 family protein
VPDQLGMMWTHTASLQDAVVKIMDRLGANPDIVQAPETIHELDSLRHKFVESRFYLVFLGQFKRGKTSLLNAFVGTDLLPTGVLPLTSIVTIVRYGAAPKARVKFLDNSTRETGIDDLPLYVTEKGNAKNKRKVAEVEVLYPADFLRDGLCLVDTPGIGSIFEHNTRVAYDFVPRADAALFVFSPESPLSQTELDFLRHLRAHVEKIFFVLNKVDQVTDGERKEIMEFAGGAIREQMARSGLHLFAVSARQGLSNGQASEKPSLEGSGLPELMATLSHFLASHGKELLFRATCASLRRIVRSQLLAFELERRALALSASAIEEKMGRIRKAWEALDWRHHEAQYILRGEVRTLESSLEKELTEFAQAQASPLSQVMIQTHRLKRQRSRKGHVKMLEEELANRVVLISEDWKAKEEKRIGEEFQRLTSRFSVEAAETIRQIQQAATEEFGFTWTASPLPDRFKVESRFGLRLERLTTWGLGQFPFLLPGGLFDRYLEGRLREACVDELHRHAGRLMADFRERLNESLNRYLRALDEYAEQARKSVLTALDRAVAAKKAGHPESGGPSPAAALWEEADRELSAIQSAWEACALPGFS